MNEAVELERTEETAQWYGSRRDKKRKKKVRDYFGLHDDCQVVLAIKANSQSRITSVLSGCA